VAELKIARDIVAATRRNRLLAALPSADFALLARHLVETDLKVGMALQEPGQEIKRVYFPHSGLISLMGVLPDGQAVETAIIGHEGAIGLTNPFGSPVALSRAVVQIAGAAAYTAPQRLAEAASQSKAVHAMLVRRGEELLAQVQQLLVCNTLHDLRQRLCRWLLLARDRIGHDEIRLTQECLSGLLSVQRTTVTTICRTLQARNVLTVRRGRIYILDNGALRREACVCYDLVRRP
jgi:CRP-like cAMP-binding protein